jgi:archaetidylinositol phosphate synthase
MSLSQIVRSQIDESPSRGFRPATRIHGSFLASAEKRALIWLAKHTPGFINSDHLTLLGSVAMMLAGASYWLARWYPPALLLTNFFLAVNWLGDSLDGTLARVRNRQRPRYGFYVDHIVDILGAVLLLGGLSLSGYMRPVIALLVLIAFLILSAEVYLATYCLGDFHLSFWRMGPTEARILLAIGNCALLWRPTVKLFNTQLQLYDVGGTIAAAGMMLAAVIAAVKHTRQLYREERI